MTTTNGNDKAISVPELRVTMQPLPFDRPRGERGRPQINPRIYLNLVGFERLVRKGVTHRQLRRKTFATVRAQLGLDPKTVIVASSEGDFFTMKTLELDSNLIVTVSPRPEREEAHQKAA